MKQSITTKIFGNGAKVKVLDYIADSIDLDYSVSSLAEASGITRQSADRLVKELTKEKVLIKTRKLGGTQLYKIDKKNELAKLILNINKLILKYQVKVNDLVGHDDLI